MSGRSFSRSQSQAGHVPGVPCVSAQTCIQRVRKLKGMGSRDGLYGGDVEGHAAVGQRYGGRWAIAQHAGLGVSSAREQSRRPRGAHGPAEQPSILAMHGRWLSRTPLGHPQHLGGRAVTVAAGGGVGLALQSPFCARPSIAPGLRLNPGMCRQGRQSCFQRLAGQRGRVRHTGAEEDRPERAVRIRRGLPPQFPQPARRLGTLARMGRDASWRPQESGCAWRNPRGHLPPIATFSREHPLPPRQGSSRGNHDGVVAPTAAQHLRATTGRQPPPPP